MDLMAADPGLSGGLCFMRGGVVVEVLDMPTLADGSNRQLDVMAICRRIDKWKPRIAIIENVQPMPSIPGANGVRRGMGAASSFRFGFAVGQIRAIAVCYGLEVILAHPNVWKRQFGLKGPDKEQSRQKALELVPAAMPWLARKRDHNRAEAVLLGLYGTERRGFL
jgi:crossover junction endodeoxyribonuclease RuvC